MFRGEKGGGREIVVIADKRDLPDRLSKTSASTLIGVVKRELVCSKLCRDFRSFAHVSSATWSLRGGV